MNKGARIGLIIVGLLVIGGVVAYGPVLGMIEKGMNKVVPHAAYPVSDKAQKLHDQLVVGDWHSDSLLWNRDLLKEEDYGHVDIPRLAKGNVALQMFTAVTKSPKGQNYEKNSADASDNITVLALAQMWPPATWTSLTARALHQADRLHDYVLKSPGQVTLIRTVQDLDQVLKRRDAGEKVVGAMLGMEGAHALDGELSNLDVLYDTGYRMVGLQHFFDNKLGGSLHGVSNAGLTDFGKQVVASANAKDMLIDLAHSGPQVVKDVVEMSTKPVVISHTGIHSHHPAKRNIPDDLMKAVAAKGGVIAIGYWADVVGDASPKGVVAAIRAAIDLVGEDHVSLGSDYDGSIEANFDTSELPALTHEMLEANFTNEEIEKVMGGNMVRLLRETLPKQ